MTPDFTFDAATHTYRIGGHVVPSVTQVIRSCAPGWMADEWYLERGKAVHEAIRLSISGRLDWTELDPRIEGRVRAALRFMREIITPDEPLETELPLPSFRHRFAGTVDLNGYFGGHKIVVCDWKSTIAPQAEVQLGAYNLLLQENSRYATRGAVVETHDDGTYKVEWLNPAALRRASNIFLHMLSVYNWKQENKLKG